MNILALGDCTMCTQIATNSYSLGSEIQVHDNVCKYIFIYICYTHIYIYIYIYIYIRGLSG